MDSITKLETTEKNLQNEIQTNITANSIETIKKQINKLNNELPKNATILNKIKKKNYAEILEYILFQLHRKTINFTKINKIEADNSRNKVISKLD